MERKVSSAPKTKKTALSSWVAPLGPAIVVGAIAYVSLVRVSSGNVPHALVSVRNHLSIAALFIAALLSLGDATMSGPARSRRMGILGGLLFADDTSSTKAKWARITLTYWWFGSFGVAVALCWMRWLGSYSVMGFLAFLAASLGVGALGCLAAVLARQAPKFSSGVSLFLGLVTLGVIGYEVLPGPNVVSRLGEVPDSTIAILGAVVGALATLGLAVIQGRAGVVGSMPKTPSLKTVPLGPVSRVVAQAMVDGGVASVVWVVGYLSIVAIADALAMAYGSVMWFIVASSFSGIVATKMLKGVDFASQLPSYLSDCGSFGSKLLRRVVLAIVAMTVVVGEVMVGVGRLSGVLVGSAYPISAVVMVGTVAVSSVSVSVFRTLMSSQGRSSPPRPIIGPLNLVGGLVVAVVPLIEVRNTILGGGDGLSIAISTTTFVLLFVIGGLAFLARRGSIESELG